MTWFANHLRRFVCPNRPTSKYLLSQHCLRPDGLNQNGYRVYAMYTPMGLAVADMLAGHNLVEGIKTHHVHSTLNKWVSFRVEVLGGLGKSGSSISIFGSRRFGTCGKVTTSYIRWWGRKPGAIGIKEVCLVDILRPSALVL